MTNMQWAKANSQFHRGPNVLFTGVDGNEISEFEQDLQQKTP